MPQNLSRRKYASIVRFLQSVLNDKSSSIRVKMQAAARLDGLYARNEEMHERAVIRREAREERERALASAALSAPVAESFPSLTPEEQRRLEEEEKDRHTANIFSQVMGRGR